MVKISRSADISNDKKDRFSLLSKELENLDLQIKEIKKMI